MRKSSLVFELTDREIRVFSFNIPTLRKSVHNSTGVKLDRVPIPTGIIEQGIVRNEQMLIELLSKYRPPKKGSYHRVCLAIPFQQGFIGVYTLPWLSKPDRRSAIALLVDEEIAIPRADIMFDFLVINEVRQQSLSVLLGAARRSLLERYANIFARAGFSLTNIDFAYLVLGQALGFKADEDVLYLQAETGTLQVVLFRGMVPESVRSLPSLPSQVQSHQCKEWENEVGRFLLFHQTQQPNFSLKRIVWNGNSGVEQLARRLSALNHNAPIEKAALNDISETWQTALEESSGFGIAAMGYGLQIFGSYIGLNLWRQPIYEEKARRTYLRLVLLTAGLFICLNSFWLMLVQRSLPMQREAETLSRQGMRMEVHNKEQAALAAAWHEVSHSSEVVGESLTQVLALAGAELKIEQVTFKQGVLSVDGRAKDSQSVQTLLQALRSRGWNKPALSSYKLDADNNIQFVVSAK